MQGHLPVNFRDCHVVFRMIQVNIFLSILFSNSSYCQEQKHVACSYKTGKTVSHSLDTINSMWWKMWSLKAQCYTNSGELRGTNSHILWVFEGSTSHVTSVCYYLIVVKNNLHLVAPNSKVSWLAPLLNMHFERWLSEWLSCLRFFMLFLLISGKLLESIIGHNHFIINLHKKELIIIALFPIWHYIKPAAAMSFLLVYKEINNY